MVWDCACWWALGPGGRWRRVGAGGGGGLSSVVSGAVSKSTGRGVCVWCGLAAVGERVYISVDELSVR